MTGNAEIAWRVHPFARQRGRGVAALATAALALALAHAWARTPLLTAAGAVLIGVSLWPFYFPVRYSLDADGVAADFGLWRRRWPWRRYRAHVPLADAVVLTPFARPHPLERYRALWLPCPDNAAAVAARVAARLPRRGDGAAGSGGGSRGDG